MEPTLSIEYIGGVILNILMFVLLIVIYTYILKLESVGCECSEHSNKSFIKAWSIISIIFLVFTSFVSMKDVNTYFGETVTILLGIITFVFYMIFVVYIYMSFQYVRFLINEKCKCSEESRREIIMTGTIIELILFFISFLVIIIIPVLIEVISSILAKLPVLQADIKESIYSPLESFEKSPAKLKKSANSLSNFMKKSSKDLKKLSKKK